MLQSPEVDRHSDEDQVIVEPVFGEMLGWGSTIHGELGLGGIEEEHISNPTPIDWFGATTVIKGALGANHTLFLTDKGKVYACGNNDYGQLGHDLPRKRPQLVAGFDAHFIINVACGAMHSMALNKWGQVFTWGSDIHGQLGQELGSTPQQIPKLVKHLSMYHVVQIAGGQRHSVALTNAGEILTWGGNDCGQLGIGRFSIKETVPKVVTSITSLPVAFIACGANHSFALSKSGSVYGWGNNNHGQLGLSDMKNREYPMQLRTLRNLKVRYISCGDEFSAFLTLDGGMFTCGAGMYGQLGHGRNDKETLPKQVIELMGSTISQIACGRHHALAFVPSRGRVYSFGLNGAGQLGLRKAGNSFSPQVVLGDWASPSGAPVVPTDSKRSDSIVLRIFAGGDHCFASIGNRKTGMSPLDYRNYDPATQILTLNRDQLEQCIQTPLNGPVDHELMSYLEVVFKSLACINGSCLTDGDSHYYCTIAHHGVHMEAVDEIFSMIPKIENTTITDLIKTSIIEIIAKMSMTPPDVECLRVFITLPFYHEFINPKQYLQIQKPFIDAKRILTQQPLKVVNQWWGALSPDHFEKLIIVFKTVASYIIRCQNIPERSTVFHDISLVAMLDTLSSLNKLNYTAEGLKVPYDTFHMMDLEECVDVRIDYVYWIIDKNADKLYLCNYPFIFDAKAKTKLLETDQKLQMDIAMNKAAQQNFITMILNQPQHATPEYLFLKVSRDNIVDDAFKGIQMVDPSELKKPLRVKFVDEEAEDAGGVRKEFFLLALRQLLDPKYGLFKEYEDTRSIWFSETFFEDVSVYLLIGIICGLAIYNFTIIDIPFPLALYKKLLGETVGLADLKGLSPCIADNMQKLLDYTGTDVEDVFGLNFEVSRNQFGEVTLIELKANGSNIPVTHENKQEYVNLYVDYILNSSIQNQYDAFYTGFMKVCGGRVLEIFYPHELMAVVVGNENYDWHEWQDCAQYKEGYSSSNQTIIWFWEVFHELPLAEKKKFLLFLTGSDRVPIQGMKAIPIWIQPTTDDKYLPVAHTCFNLLDLPRYQTKEKLRYKLLQAMQQTEGFSLV